MKFTLISAAFLAALTFAPSAAFARDWYVKAEYGQAFNTEVEGFSLADDQTFGAYVGTAVGPVRVEVGANRTSADSFGANIHATRVTATAYIDTASGFFVGAGPDYVMAEADFGPFSANTSGYGWHATGGYAARVSDRAIVEVAYRYSEAETDVDFSSHAATVGLRFRL